MFYLLGRRASPSFTSLVHAYLFAIHWVLFSSKNLSLTPLTGSVPHNTYSQRTLSVCHTIFSYLGFYFSIVWLLIGLPCWSISSMGREPCVQRVHHCTQPPAWSMAHRRQSVINPCWMDKLRTLPISLNTLSLYALHTSSCPAGVHHFLLLGLPSTAQEKGFGMVVMVVMVSVMKVQKKKALSSGLAGSDVMWHSRVWRVRHLWVSKEAHNVTNKILFLSLLLLWFKSIPI